MQYLSKTIESGPQLGGALQRDTGHESLYTGTLSIQCYTIYTLLHSLHTGETRNCMLYSARCNVFFLYLECTVQIIL